MSIATWKAEFYPVEASDVPESEAVAHSLQKWIGLRYLNMQKHGVKWGVGEGYRDCCICDAEGAKLRIDAWSCALCLHHYGRPEYANSCHTCPLCIARGGVACDDEREGSFRENHLGSPWEQKFNTPEPMIYWLKKALKKDEHTTD